MAFLIFYVERNDNSSIVQSSIYFDKCHSVLNIFFDRYHIHQSSRSGGNYFANVKSRFSLVCHF